MSLICLTKANSDPKGKSRVYFTCHPDDAEYCIKKLSADIFKTHDCAIYYAENMGTKIDTQDMELDLGTHNLFVIPVTRLLLTAPNRTMDIDLPYAIKEHIPVLPIMMESGIEHLYSKEDKFGEMQFLNAISTDSSEISYEDKLKKFLDSVLINDKLASRVRAAFDAYIFLSYRKKDRKHANELMRMIHRNPEFRDIAIWYDEFLVPGESFNDNIAKIMSDSKLFTLLVTPNLLEEPGGNPNFVMGQEYPAAIDIGLPIVPVEMEATDKKKLEEKFAKIPMCVNPHEEYQFKEIFLKALSRIVFREHDQNPAHNFLIGLAYLEGIDVEIDRNKGVSIIRGAADSGLEEATRKMIEIYLSGTGVSISYFRAKEWFEKLLSQKEEQSDSVEGMISLMEACDEYCDFLLKHFLSDYSPFVNKKMLPLVEAYVSEHKNVHSDETQNAMLFWLCKSYYRSVHADMVRDADDHNAESYGELIKCYKPLIKNENYVCIINECLDYIDQAKKFWSNFGKGINETIKKGKETKNEESIEEILRLVALCESEHDISPSEETTEKLIDAYSKIMDYYEKKHDPISYPKYTMSYLALKVEQFYSDPDIMESLDIVWRYNDLIDFLIENKYQEAAIVNLNNYVLFLKYLLDIGSDCRHDCFDALTKLATLYKKNGEQELYVKALKEAEKYKDNQIVSACEC